MIPTAAYDPDSTSPKQDSHMAHVPEATFMTLCTVCGVSCAAVLRRLLREQEQGTLPEPPMPDASTPPDKAAEMLAVATSHPTWMVARWLQRWGQQEAMRLLAHNNRSPPPLLVSKTRCCCGAFICHTPKLQCRTLMIPRMACKAGLCTWSLFDAVYMSVHVRPCLGVLGGWT